MFSSEVQVWRKRLDLAWSRCEVAKRRKAESVIERLSMSASDCYLAHDLAVREEIEALKEYRDLCAAFKQAVLSVEPRDD